MRKTPHSRLKKSAFEFLLSNIEINVLYSYVLVCLHISADEVYHSMIMKKIQATEYLNFKQHTLLRILKRYNTVKGPHVKLTSTGVNLNAFSITVPVYHINLIAQFI